MGLRRLLEACQLHEKVGLKHSSKSAKYELEVYYNAPVHEHVSFLKTAKLPRECNEDTIDCTSALCQVYFFQLLFEKMAHVTQAAFQDTPVVPFRRCQFRMQIGPYLVQFLHILVTELTYWQRDTL